uniref:Protein TIC 214 n=1 Tax=Radula japonica TaxID=1068553 RepID=A0A4Y5P6R5_9MARC|nr:Ycf1 [Radula japonica]QCW58726.1 Ycf1 [Radula japonica]
MITSIPSLFSILWISIFSQINFSSTLILFGLYYGFLTTLPISPSQLLSMRAFLLEGRISGTVSFSGLITGQLIIYLSIYYSPLYVILLKPHILSLLILSYIFISWYKIKDLLNFQSLRPITSYRDIRIYKIFFDSMIFQLFNPILLPSSLLTRLLNIFFFRYSNHILFIVSTIFGWLYGQYFFINSSKALLHRIESDSPILYLLVKRLIHRIFSIFILAFSLLHLGRIPVPFITKKIIQNLQLKSSKQEKSRFIQKSWPGLFFDYRQWKRPLRYIENSRFSTQSLLKGRVSQYFFNSCLSDGIPKLSFTYLPSVALFEKNFDKYLTHLEFLSYSKFFKEWIIARKKKKKYIYKQFKEGIALLDSGFSMIEIMEKETGLVNFKGKIFNRFYDPLLIRQSNEAMIISKSPWFFTGKYDKSKRTQKHRFLIKKNNRLKNWISNQCKQLEYKNFVLPWEPLPRDARRILALLINSNNNSKKENYDINSKEVKFYEMEKEKNSHVKNNVSIGNMHKKMNRKSNLNWELILNLSSPQKNLYFRYLQIEKWNTLKNYWKNFFLGNITPVRNISFSLATIFGIDKKLMFHEMEKELPRWTADSKNDKFDVIAIGVTDIRQRKVKNLGYLIKGKDRRKKIVRRFSQQSDFRRKLVKGSMRARRRKTLIWKVFQLGINSPFFLRICEKYISFNERPFFESELTFKNILKKKNETFFKKRTSFFEKTRSDRLAIANRWDFPLAQWGRSWLLIIQSHFRKYIALPFLIILKNVSRFLLFQNPEWNEDWYQWNKEIHIKCTYDGTEVSKEELPEQWLRDGLQIKIIYPFYLKPWYNCKIQSENRGKRLFRYCYLTAWGFLTDLPFGNIKKHPSFWKPIKKKLKNTWRKNIFLKIFNQIREKDLFTIPLTIMNLKKNYIEIDNSIKSTSYKLDSQEKYTEIFINNKNKKTTNNYNPIVNISKKFENETLLYKKKLEDLVTKKKSINEGKVYLKKNRDKFQFSSSKIETRNRLYKELIKLKQIIIQFCTKNIELLKNWFFILKINIQRMIIDSKINIEIIKESILYFFTN